MFALKNSDDDFILAETQNLSYLVLIVVCECVYLK
jgi:hypothetical protein